MNNYPMRIKELKEGDAQELRDFGFHVELIGSGLYLITFKEAVK